MKIATPISTLFSGNQANVQAILALSDALEVRDLSKKTNYGLPLIYHCEFSLIHPWSGKSVDHVRSVVARNPDVSFISLHLLSNYADLATNAAGQFCSSIAQMSKDEMFQNALNNLGTLKKHLPATIVYGVENNNYFPTGAYDIVTEPEFVNNVISKLDIKLLLDLGHSEITAYYQKVNALDYVKNFFLDRVYQIHLSSPLISKSGCQDSHDILTEHDWNFFAKVLPLCPNLQYLTIEYYKDIGELISMLDKLRHILYEYQK